MSGSPRGSRRAPGSDARGAHGVYAILCTATGEVWVGLSAEMAQARAQAFDALRAGAHVHTSLQAAFDRHGETAFRFEELDRVRADLTDQARAEDLARRQAVWSPRLQAERL